MTIDVHSAMERVDRHQRAVEAAPDSAACHLNLGTALLQAGRLQQAEQALRKAIELEPSLARAHVNLGGILLSRWDFHGCIEANRAASACSPDMVEAHYNEGLGHLYLGEPDAVVACFRRVLELDPRHAGGHYYLAVGLLACGDVQGSREHVAIATELGFSPQPDFLKALEKAENEPVPVLEIGG